jgi:hypothetical protein
MMALMMLMMTMTMKTVIFEKMKRVALLILISLQKVGEINLLLCIKSLFRSVLFKFVALTCALLFINYLFMFGCLHISQLENWRNLFFGVCSVGGFVNTPFFFKQFSSEGAHLYFSCAHAYCRFPNFRSTVDRVVINYSMVLSRTYLVSKAAKQRCTSRGLWMAFRLLECHTTSLKFLEHVITQNM